MGKTQLILVLGLARSGTSWVGRALAAGAHARHVREPFNPRHNPGVKVLDMLHVPEGEQDERLLSVLRACRDRRRLGFLRPRAVLVKDVHCLLAARMIDDALSPSIAIVVRHPCAMAESWRRLMFAVQDRIPRLTNQPSLVREYLEPHLDHLASSRDYFFQLGALWGASYGYLHQLSETRPHWAWARHEDLCADPECAFARLAGDLGVPFGPAGRRFLHQQDRERREDEGPYATGPPHEGRTREVEGSPRAVRGRRRPRWGPPLRRPPGTVPRGRRHAMTRLALVQGMPRSGTSWTALVLSAPRLVRLVNEPFNPILHPEVEGVDVRRTAVGTESPQFLDVFQRSLDVRCRLGVPPRALVIKDVHGYFLTRELCAAFGPALLTVIRHPCAVAASWRRVGFTTARLFARVTDDPLLDEEFLAPMRDHLLSRDDEMFRIGALWGVIYGYQNHFRDSVPGWEWARHEDLCVDPRKRFAELAKRLSLPAGRRLDQALSAYESRSRPSADPFVTRRATADEPGKWKEELTPAEAKSVLDGAEPFGVLEEFYPEA